VSRFGDGAVVDRGGAEVAHRTAPAAGAEREAFPEEAVQFGEVLSPDPFEKSLAVFGVMRFAQPATQVPGRIRCETARGDCGSNRQERLFNRLLVQV